MALQRYIKYFQLLVMSTNPSLKTQVDLQKIKQQSLNALVSYNFFLYVSDITMKLLDMLSKVIKIILWIKY